MRWLVIPAALALAACGTAPAKPSPPVVQVQRVDMVVREKCAADPGPDPILAATPESIAAAPTIFEEVKLLLATIDQLKGQVVGLKAANSGCR